VLTVDRRRRPAWIDGGCVEVKDVRKGALLRLEHDLKNETHDEVIGARPYQVTWRGSDVVDIHPHGEPLRLYQRLADVPKEVPAPPARAAAQTPVSLAPTEQKR